MAPSGGGRGLEAFGGWREATGETAGLLDAPLSKSQSGACTFWGDSAVPLPADKGQGTLSYQAVKPQHWAPSCW